jgi:hypothetical protein
VENKIIVAGGVIRMCQLETQSCRKGGPGRVHIHQLEPVEWKIP